MSGTIHANEILVFWARKLLPRIFTKVFFTFFVFIGLTACGGVEPPKPVHLTITGSTSMAPLVRSLATAYHQRFPHVTFDVEAQGSALGLARAEQGTTDVGMVARPISREEMFDPKTGRRRLWQTLIARDGLAIIVNRQNRLQNLTGEQVRAIFTGDVTRWKDLGWGGEDIQVVSREAHAGMRQEFETRFLGEGQETLNAIVVPTSAAMQQYIAAHREAIGYLSMGLADDRVKVLAVDGLRPTPATVAGGTYSYVHPLILVAGVEPHGETRAFLNFVTTPAGRAIIRRQYALPGGGG